MGHWARRPASLAAKLHHRCLAASFDRLDGLMQTPCADDHWYFVDETGDPVFYDRHGSLIVGHEGCSPILALGFIDTGDPWSIRRALACLHNEIAHDSYLQAIPSISKTNRSFHAKDDTPEVRYLVYRCLRDMEFRAQFIVARKIERVFRGTFHAREDEFYDYLVSRLFQDVLHRHPRNHICFSRRGSRTRQSRLQEAINRGIQRFEERWGKSIRSNISVESQTGVGEPCLQVVDYMNWAVYRAFVRREMRYYAHVADKVSLLVDLYDKARYPHNWYSRRNPFSIEKASPL